MLRLPEAIVARIGDQAIAGYPYEVCGLLAGPSPDEATHYFECRNAAASARVYTIDPRDHLRAEREADEHGLEVIGVVHSHTHTPAYPSPTDVAQAPVPSWHYVICSLRHETPELRSFRIVDGSITEEPIEISPGPDADRPLARG